MNQISTQHIANQADKHDYSTELVQKTLTPEQSNTIDIRNRIVALQNQIMALEISFEPRLAELKNSGSDEYNKIQKEFNAMIEKLHTRIEVLRNNS